ncbi:hypothetical protein [Arthrobacter dokdonensis]|uniref:hypothetical protein n=1 Tax=Arthrobacter dokdonellae TaxID=2211210 RepID=UPI000DE58D4E|nr:hypothetical protein [Arthrobacter dokdonellae]
MTDTEPSLAEQRDYFKFQMVYWRARALAAEGKHKTPVIPETDTHRRISYRDPTGERACSAADRTTKGNHHGKAKQRR